MRRHQSRLAGPAAPRRRAGTFTEAGLKGSRREEPQGEIKFLDTLVEVPGISASDAGSTPAASTTVCIREQGRGAVCTSRNTSTKLSEAAPCGLLVGRCKASRPTREAATCPASCPTSGVSARWIERVLAVILTGAEFNASRLSARRHLLQPASPWDTNSAAS